MNSFNSATLERNAILLTVWGNLAFGIIGIVFSIKTDSEAILLDGLFSFINFLIGLVTLKVSQLVISPENRHYPFGYAVYEPMLNLAKGLIIITVCVFALVSSVEAITKGGREIELDNAIYYAFIAAGGCLLMAAVLSRIAKKVASPIVTVDAKNWLVDAILSMTVLLSFIGMYYLEKGPLAHYVPFIDPILVILLIVFSIFIPIKIVKENWGQIIGKSPPEDEVRQAEAIVKKCASTLNQCQYHIRTGRFGRLFYLHVYFLVDVQQEIDIEQQDQIRTELYQDLIALFPNLAVDIIFTRDATWVIRAVSSD